MNFTTFKRSAEIPIPSVWRSFSKCTKEGKKLFFKVQDVTEELKDECLKHMSEVFLRDEHVFSCIKILEDELSLKELQAIFSVGLGHNLALVCLVDEDENFKNPKVAGVNLTYMQHKNDDIAEFTFNGEVMQTAVRIAKYLDCFEDLGVDECLNSFGLVVLPEYRGMGVGKEILLARDPLAKAVGLKVASTPFSSLKSQKVGKSAGYELLKEFPYKDWNKKFPPYVFDQSETPSMIVASKKIE